MNVHVYFNPECSKCRTVSSILEERGVEPEYVRYLEQAPTREQLEKVMQQLGAEHPHEMMRTQERLYDELGLASATPDELLDAMTAHPILVQRPIIIHGGRAVIARPPQRALELLEDG